MGSGLLPGEEAASLLLPDNGVIGGDLIELARTDPVGPAVPDVHKGQMIALDEGSDQGGPHPPGHQGRPGEPQDSLVGQGDRSEKAPLFRSEILPSKGRPFRLPGP